MISTHRVLLTAAAVLLGSLVCAAVNEPNRFVPHRHDWPQWQGPDRTNRSRESGLLQEWPKEGPKLLWKTTGLGGGYSTPSVAAGRIFGMGYRGDDEVVWALDESTGMELWSTRIAAANHKVGYNEGSRSTPTVDGQNLYALGVSGDLVCLTADKGAEVWHKNLVKDFGGSIPGWGYSESVLVDGDVVIASPGRKTATLVALDKRSGTVIWKAQVPQGDGAGYASAIVATVAGQRQYVQFLHGGVVGIAATDGRFLWRYNRPANGTANCSTAIVHQDAVFAASNYGVGGGLAKLTKKEAEVQAEEVWFTKEIKNHHGGVILLDGQLYGSNDGLLVCLDWQTGKVVWDSRIPGKGSITYADGCLYYRNEGGPMYLVAATPATFTLKGKFTPPERSKKPAWAHPIIANGKLYLRDQDVLLCYDVRKPDADR